MAPIDNIPDSGHPLLEELTATFAPGQLIPHTWLKTKLLIRDKKELKFKDYDNEAAYWTAVEQLERQYRLQITLIRERLLEARKGYLASRPGEGYMILPYDEQVSYAYCQFRKALERNILKTGRIMRYRPPVSAEQQVIDRNTIARFSWFRQTISMMDEIF